MSPSAELLERGRNLCREGKLAEGIELLRKVVTSEPQNAAAHNLMGMALDRLGNLAEALPCFDRAIAADPKFTDALANKADALSALGRYREAIKLYDQALGIDENNAIGWLNRGVAFHATGEFEKSLASLDRALSMEPDNLLAMFNRATTLAAMGRHEDQVTTLRRLLALQPGNIEAQLLLGGALLRAGRPAEALDPFEKALAQDGKLFSAHVGRGHALNALNRFEDALASYEGARAQRDDLAELHAGRSLALTKLDRNEEALAAIDRALELEENSARYLSHRISILQALGRNDDASASIDKATELSASDPQFHLKRGNAFRTAGDRNRARECYMQVLKIDSRNIDAMLALGEISIDERDRDGALSFGLEAIKTKETGETKDYFVRRILGLGLVSDNVEFRATLIKAIRDVWTLPRLLFPYAATLIRNGVARGLIDDALKHWPKPFSARNAATGKTLEAIFKDQLLIATLSKTQFAHVEFEKFLTLLRRQLLEMALAPDSIEDFQQDALTFASALAQQCYIDEYVFRFEDAEKEMLEKLVQEIKADSSRKAPALFRIAVAACYRPLHEIFRFTDFKNIVAAASFKDLVALQLEEPETLVRIRAEIPRLTPIEDDVSAAVREMYEESPYPRWITMPQIPPAKTPEQELRMQFPRAEIQPRGEEKSTDVLVAGCGTGRQLCFTTRYPNSKVLAVDLSLSSLSYAKMKMDAEGEKRISFGQADILKLGSLGRTFDVIFSTGVLHHMKDPEAGWSVLVSLLKAEGFMHIGLYSEIAREQVIAARKVIAERKIAPTVENIRSFRQEIGFAEWSPLQKAATMSDFFTLNETRDLLFHVQEHRFTIPRIKRFLEDNNLAFLGFDVPQTVLKKFAEEHPGSAPQDLDAWDEFEQKNPDTFLGMYNFWLQKRKPN